VKRCATCEGRKGAVAGSASGSGASGGGAASPRRLTAGVSACSSSHPQLSAARAIPPAASIAVPACRSAVSRDRLIRSVPSERGVSVANPPPWLPRHVGSAHDHALQAPHGWLSTHPGGETSSGRRSNSRRIRIKGSPEMPINNSRSPLGKGQRQREAECSGTLNTSFSRSPCLFSAGGRHLAWCRRSPPGLPRTRSQCAD
jgi:hypothetical protein